MTNLALRAFLNTIRERTGYMYNIDTVNIAYTHKLGYTAGDFSKAYLTDLGASVLHVLKHNSHDFYEGMYKEHKLVDLLVVKAFRYELAWVMHNSRLVDELDLKALKVLYST